ncbi:hypothetical protein PA905_21000 [Planktothrix agardhii CCAP 1459/11A]|jgi:hypothetical protein|uniref:Uncharacterized protein n=1 Tax=Planktothrix agardhii CCAP 1459/11A TaxID=282420 RepID=A0A4P5ZDM9_PLAAG|nr:hypothetical protein PA905_21000 [Planktothrix agardhii CCAP 1459/11A]CAD5924428.1 hypothetical protein NO108_01255 [Planktothrix rubescens]CAD5942678.1 hypothetical protein PCC7821_02008 [Planktothrix rubescens NIVA-CYA 18]CAD5945836.1 hypothetical protein NO365_02227 [Planktothrix agardhii]CAH2572557.1 hypothetical protein PRNO82_01962 [Planktothrix rubescens]
MLKGFNLSPVSLNNSDYIRETAFTLKVIQVHDVTRYDLLQRFVER